MSRTQPVVELLRAIVGQQWVLVDRDALVAYECDGFPIAKGRPSMVVLPSDPPQVSRCVKVLAQHGLTMVPRGSGTGLTGGCVVFDDGVLVATTRMTAIESIDLHHRVAVVQAGVRNRALSQAVAAMTSGGTGSVAIANHPHDAPGDSEEKPATLRFSPNPSSEAASTIGGNAATNAGGINTLKYGVTTNHILGLEMVLPDGETLLTRPGGVCDGIGPDLPGLICGSEGTLGIITRLWCRLTPEPTGFRTVYAVFDSPERACQAVSAIIASGVVPSAMEMLDGVMIRVVRQAFNYGFPDEAAALLLVEVDGVSAALDEQLAEVLQGCRSNQAVQIRHCATAAQRAELWSVRKRAFGAIGRISRSYCTQDACIPRSKLPQAMRRITDIGRDHGLTITNVFHAGDGNVHPILLFDEDDPHQVQLILRVSEQILEYCLSIGGTITGEHGIGVEKLALMPKMFNPATLDTFTRIKQAFDPDRRINDGKLIPSPRLKIQLSQPASINLPGGAGAA